MFNAIGAKTLFIFGACNILSIPMVWALYPESNQRTLEEMDLLFEADSIWNWAAEKNFAKLKLENPDLVAAASRGNSVVDPERGVSAILEKRKASVSEPAAEHIQETEQKTV